MRGNVYEREICTYMMGVSRMISSNQFQTVAERIKEQQDLENCKKILDLADKWAKRRLIIAFCGHFSAGKSTMVNTLVGTEVLPSSPIPTSANLVLIGHGEAVARAYKVDGNVSTFALTEDGRQALKTLCADGTTVERVEITVPTSFLPDHVYLMDTPGIDSTDDAHRLVTESTLHLADAVFYVVDYNHVQSELNFQFTKTLIDHGKRVWLIVNQIDKHFDLEMDFASYQESTEEAFRMWGIGLEGIYYTSLVEPDHPENQFGQLQDDLQRLFQQTDSFLQSSILRAAKGIVEDHIHFVQLRKQEDLEHWQELAAQHPDASLDSLREQLQAVESQIEQANALATSVETELLKKVDSILANAPLTPYPTMERIERFLESRQGKFRVGLFGSKTKTEQEKAARLQSLLADLQERVQSAIEWHLKQLFMDALKEQQLRADAFQEELQDLQISITEEMLLHLLNPGATFSGEYVHTYARDVRSAIQSAFRRKAIEKIEGFADLVMQGTKQQIAQLEQQKERMLTSLKALESIAQFEDAIASYKQELLKMLGI
jgi:GTP-binding protein EngB required for normal cell division